MEKRWPFAASFLLLLARSPGGARARERVPGAPLLLGSGVTADNAAALLALCDGAIVGTWLKAGGVVRAPIDRTRVVRLRAAFDAVV